MRATTKLLTRLPFFVVIAAMVVLLAQTIILNTVNPDTAAALSITSITSEYGPVAGGQTVTITGDFGIPDAPLEIVQIAAGTNHSIALDSEGRVFAWGHNYSGQLGNGTNIDSNAPVAVDTTGVLAGRDIVQVAAGWSHSIALDSEGRVFAWGGNWYGGQLGNGTNIDNNVPVAVDMTGVLAGRKIVYIAAGHHYSIALDSEGNIFAWGRNGNGQLGNGMGGDWSNDWDSNVPVAVNMFGVLAGRDIVQVSAGGAHTLVLDSEGRVFAWGWNNFGQLGNGISGTWLNSTVPVAVNMFGVLAGRDIVQVSAGSHSLALDSEGRVFAWGHNGEGQLGNGTNIHSTVPVAVNMTGVLAGRNIVQMTGGQVYTLALDSEGNIFAWGRNTGGQLGNGMGGDWSTSWNSNIPVAVNMTGVLAGRNIVQVVAGWGHHSVALDSEGNVFAWGRNDGGQFGNCTNIGSNVPILINLGCNTPMNPIESVTLGGLPCTDIRIINRNTITCVTPAHPAGTVDVVVNTLHGSVTLYRGYTYIDIPDVPNTGHLRQDS